MGFQSYCCTCSHGASFQHGQPCNHEAPGDVKGSKFKLPSNRDFNFPGALQQQSAWGSKEKALKALLCCPVKAWQCSRAPAESLGSSGLSSQTAQQSPQAFQQSEWLLLILPVSKMEEGKQTTQMQGCIQKIIEWRGMSLVTSLVTQEQPTWQGGAWWIWGGIAPSCLWLQVWSYGFLPFQAESRHIISKIYSIWKSKKDVFSIPSLDIISHEVYFEINSQQRQVHVKCWQSKVIIKKGVTLIVTTIDQSRNTLKRNVPGRSDWASGRTPHSDHSGTGSRHPYGSHLVPWLRAFLIAPLAVLMARGTATGERSAKLGIFVTDFQQFVLALRLPWSPH